MIKKVNDGEKLEGFGEKCNFDGETKYHHLGMMHQGSRGWQGMLSVIVSISRGQYSPLLQKVVVKSNRPAALARCLHKIHQDITGYTTKMMGCVRIYQQHKGIYRIRSASASSISSLAGLASMNGPTSIVENFTYQYFQRLSHRFLE